MLVAAAEAFQIQPDTPVGRGARDPSALQEPSFLLTPGEEAGPQAGRGDSHAESSKCWGAGRHMINNLAGEDVSMGEDVWGQGKPGAAVKATRCGRLTSFPADCSHLLTSGDAASLTEHALHITTPSSVQYHTGDT